jgi:hypothetical protein
MIRVWLDRLRVECDCDSHGYVTYANRVKAGHEQHSLDLILDKTLTDLLAVSFVYTCIYLTHEKCTAMDFMV